jgi:DHHC palmitoyltransferase
VLVFVVLFLEKKTFLFFFGAMTKKRAWQEWPSKQVWYCDGRFVSGPDRLYFYISLTMLLVPSALFWALTVPYLVEHVSWALAAASGALVAFSLVTLFIAGFTDPGVYPRRPKPRELDRKINILAKTPDALNYCVRDIKVSSKYCNTCNIWRPPRSSHCSVCDACVDHFDHHWYEKKKKKKIKNRPKLTNDRPHLSFCRPAILEARGLEIALANETIVTFWRL